MQNHNQCLADGNFTQHSHFSENHARKTQRAPGFEPRSPSDLDHQALNKVVVSVAVKARALLSNTSHFDFFFPNLLVRVLIKIGKKQKITKTHLGRIFCKISSNLQFLGAQPS